MAALSRKLKLMNVFLDGVSFAGETQGVTLPNLAKATEEFRGGGMLGPVKQTTGHQAIELEHKYGGPVVQIVRQMGITRVDGLMVRFAGAYQRPDGDGVDAVEVVVRGFHEEVDRGTDKTGDDSEMSVKTACSYYKESWNGEVIYEVDLLTGLWIVDGVDVYAQLRAAVGLA